MPAEGVDPRRFYSAPMCKACGLVLCLCSQLGLVRTEDNKEDPALHHDTTEPCSKRQKATANGNTASMQIPLASLWTWDARAAMLKMPVATLRRLMATGVPPLLLHILFRIRDAQLSAIGMLELFAGKKELTKASVRAGIPTIGIDLNIGKTQWNLMSDQGFINSVVMSFRVAQYEGWQHFATVCSNFCWMATSSTGRSKDAPLGRIDGNVKVDYPSGTNLSHTRPKTFC